MVTHQSTVAVRSGSSVESDPTDTDAMDGFDRDIVRDISMASPCDAAAATAAVGKDLTLASELSSARMRTERLDYDKQKEEM